jgi:hypothetical protein
MEEQSNWREHAWFMDDLVDRGIVVMGGPLADLYRVVLVVHAESDAVVRDILAGDPWFGTHLLIDSLDQWTIRLDARHP